MLIYLIAGEPSGDMLGARLMRALKEQNPSISFAGVGGDNMEKEGMTSLFNITDLAIMGLVEVIPSIPKVLRHIKNTVSDIEQKKPDVVITIDSWSFSARVHKALRKKGIKVKQMHYVAPQVWAWKKKRAKTMYKYIDRLLTLFPNEPKYFTPYKLKADFVGHPVIESSMISADKNDFISKYNIPDDKKIVLVLPGSRHNEVANLLPLFLDVVDELNKLYPDLFFVLPTVKTVENRVRKIIEEKNADILVLTTQEERYACAKASKMAIAASGTVALELAIVDVPHLIAYKVPKLTAWLVRHIANIKFVNLTNILLDRLIVPEILQEDCTKETLLNTAKELLDESSSLYKREKEGFVELRKTLGVGKAKPSQKACEIILEEISGNE
jgi:lipid-A-disaccharide synthase